MLPAEASQGRTLALCRMAGSIMWNWSFEALDNFLNNMGTSISSIKVKITTSILPNLLGQCKV
jgi:hypothetical protein